MRQEIKDHVSIKYKRAIKIQCSTLKSKWLNKRCEDTKNTESQKMHAEIKKWRSSDDQEGHTGQMD